MANFLFGGYLSFHSSIEIMRSLYHHNPKLQKLKTRRKGIVYEGGSSVQSCSLSGDSSCLYSDHSSEEEKLINFDIKLGTCTKIYIYFLDLFHCLNICTMIHNKKVSEIKELVDKGNKNIAKDFDIKNIVRHIKLVSAKANLNSAIA